MPPPFLKRASDRYGETLLLDAALQAQRFVSSKCAQAHTRRTTHWRYTVILLQASLSTMRPLAGALHSHGTLEMQHLRVKLCFGHELTESTLPASYLTRVSRIMKGDKLNLVIYFALIDAEDVEIQKLPMQPWNEIPRDV